MAFEIRDELKQTIEKHPEIIEFIEEGKIDELYYMFNPDNPHRIELNFLARNDIRRILMELEIDPLKYLTRLPTAYMYNDDANNLTIPHNINKISRQAIQFCDINTLQIDAQTIDMSAYAIVDSNINNFICKSGIITTFEYARFTTVINNIGDKNTKFVFKNHALVQDGLRPGKSKIEDVIRENNLDDKYNIQLI